MAGVQANVLVAVVKVAPEGRPEAEYVNVPPLASVAETVNCRSCPAVTVLLPIVLNTGATLAAATVTTILA